MNKRLLAVAGLASILVLSACASDKKPPRPGPAERAMRSPKSTVGLLLSRYDSNQDRIVSQSELEAGLAQSFTEADADHDHTISPLEFEAFSKSRVGGNSSPPFRLDFDRNVDGRITPIEFDTELEAIAKNLDEDKDGALSETELSKAKGDPPPGAERASSGPGDGPSGNDPPRGRRPR